jgi:hypothetical protein
VATNNQAASASEVREKFKRAKPLKDISVKQRGWTLDVLNIVRRIAESRRRGDESLTEKLKLIRDSSRRLLPMNSQTRRFMPSLVNWKNCIPTTATSVTKSASNFKSSATQNC